VIVAAPSSVPGIQPGTLDRPPLAVQTLKQKPAR
jgi:hypothetical protein